MKNATRVIGHERMRSRESQVARASEGEREVFRRPRYSLLAALPLAAGTSRSQSLSYAHLFCVVPNIFEKKRDCSYSHLFISSFCNLISSKTVGVRSPPQRREWRRANSERLGTDQATVCADHLFLWRQINGRYDSSWRFFHANSFFST